MPPPKPLHIPSSWQQRALPSVLAGLTILRWAEKECQQNGCHWNTLAAPLEKFHSGYLYLFRAAKVISRGTECTTQSHVGQSFTPEPWFHMQMFHELPSALHIQLDAAGEYSLKLLFYHSVALSFSSIMYCARKSCRPESHRAIPVSLSLSPKFTVCCKFSVCCNWAGCKFTEKQEFWTTAVTKLPPERRLEVTCYPSQA